ncbi:hypothetical protein ACQJBY_069569 [Aegilops geniculata]
MKQENVLFSRLCIYEIKISVDGHCTSEGQLYWSCSSPFSVHMISASSLYYVVLGYKLVFSLLLQLDYISNFSCSYAEILLASGKGTYCLIFFFLCIFLQLEGVGYCHQVLG